MALIDTLQDNFNDNSFDTGKWTRSSGTLVLEQNNRMELVTGSNSKNIRSTNSYDLTGSYIQFRYIDHLQGNIPPQFGLQIGTSISYVGGDRFAIDFNTAGDVRCVMADSGTTTYSVFGARGSYEYFRIREASGTVYWDASVDGISWTNMWSQAVGIVITALYAYAICTFIFAASSNRFYFDNVNILNYDLQPPQIASTTLYAPTLVPGPVSLTMPTISSGAATYAPTVAPGAVSLILPSISSTMMFMPEVSLDGLTIPHLPSADQLFAFAVTTGPIDISPPLLTNTDLLYEPLVSPDQDISVTFITSTEQLFAPLVSPGSVDLLVTFITSTEQVFAMTLVAGPATLTLPSIGGATLYAPTVLAEPMLLLPFIDSSGQLYAMSIGFLIGIKPKGASGILRPEGYAIKDGPRVGTEPVRPGSVVPLPSPDVATEVVMAAIQPAANQVPFYSEAQYIDADAIGVDADAAVDAGYSVYALQSSPIGAQRAARGIGSQEAPAPAVTSGEQKPSGKIVISIPR